MAFKDRSEVAAKVDWEGGLYDSLDYGLKVDDMPEGDEELREAWEALEKAFQDFEVTAERVYDLLPDAE